MFPKWYDSFMIEHPAWSLIMTVAGFLAFCTVLGVVISIVWPMVFR